LAIVCLLGFGLHAGGKSLAALTVISSPAHSDCTGRQQGNRREYNTALPPKASRDSSPRSCNAAITPAADTEAMTITLAAPTLFTLFLLTSGGALAGACSHPYIPLPGTYTYQTGGAGPGNTMVSTVKAVGNTMQISSSVNGNATEATFDCQTGKVVVNVAGKSMGINNTSLPDAGRWKVGYTWKSTTEVSGMTVNAENRIVAAERVTTPAGTFDALKVETTSKVDMSGMLGGQKLPPEVMKKMEASLSKVKSSVWYVKGVGMVQNVSERSTMTLISIKR
jgi:hypothetical protein